MAKLPSVSYSDVIKALSKAGFVYAPKRGKGSHIAMYKVYDEGKTRLVIIPRKKNIPKGTLLSILRQAGLSKEEFLELLK